VKDDSVVMVNAVRNVLVLLVLAATVVACDGEPDGATGRSSSPAEAGARLPPIDELCAPVCDLRDSRRELRETLAQREELLARRFELQMDIERMQRQLEAGVRR